MNNDNVDIKVILFAAGAIVLIFLILAIGGIFYPPAWVWLKKILTRLGGGE